MSDTRLIKSYVWHGEECFYVSTIDRDSSAVLGPRRFAETIVWKFNWATQERTELISTHGGLAGSIFAHFQVCQFLHETGSPEIPEDNEVEA